MSRSVKDKQTNKNIFSLILQLFHILKVLLCTHVEGQVHFRLNETTKPAYDSVQ